MFEKGLLAGKRILITGVSSGFGRALAEEAMAAGHRVAGTVRGGTAKAELEKLAAGRGIFKLLDVGDDAAVLKPFVGEAIISTDVSVLGVHLEESLFAIEDFGYKAVMAALSDLAAMGARPRGLVVAVTSPTGTDLDALHHGVAEAAQLTLRGLGGGGCDLPEWAYRRGGGVRTGLDGRLWP